MKKTMRKIMSLILCAVLLFTTASVAFAAEDGRKVIDNGYCGAEGENLTWTLYDDGELVISGEGEMDWYYPWYGCTSGISNRSIRKPVCRCTQSDCTTSGIR